MKFCSVILVKRILLKTNASVDVPISHKFIFIYFLFSESFIPPNVSIAEISEALAIHELNDLLDLDDNDALEDELGKSLSFLRRREKKENSFPLLSSAK